MQLKPAASWTQQVARGDDRYEMKERLRRGWESEVCMAVNLKMTSGLEGDEKLLLTDHSLPVT